MLLHDGEGGNYLDSRLSTACHIGDLAKVKRLIEQGVETEGEFRTAMVEACRYGQLEIVKYLVSIGASLERAGEYHGHTPVTAACLHGNLELVKYLNSIGADMESKGEWMYPFRLACKGGHIKIIKYLISIGIRSKKMYNEGIRSATHNGHFKLADYLISIGGDCNAGISDKIGGVKLNALKYLASVGADVTNEDEYKLLHHACTKGKLEMVKYLISLKVPTSDDAIDGAIMEGHIDVVKYLLSVGAEICECGEAEYDLEDYLDHFCETGGLKMVKFLVSLGSDVHDGGDGHPIRMAGEHGHLEIVKYLISIGADVTVRDNWALRCSRENVKECLIDTVLTEMKKFTVFLLLNKNRLIVKDLIRLTGLSRWVEHYPYYQECETLLGLEYDPDYFD